MPRSCSAAHQGTGRNRTERRAAVFDAALVFRSASGNRTEQDGTGRNGAAVFDAARGFDAASADASGNRTEQDGTGRNRMEHNGASDGKRATTEQAITGTSSTARRNTSSNATSTVQVQ